MDEKIARQSIRRRHFNLFNGPAAAHFSSNPEPDPWRIITIFQEIISGQTNYDFFARKPDLPDATKPDHDISEPLTH